MNAPRFRIIFEGTLMPDVDLDRVKDNLVRLFKSERSRIDKLFGRGPVEIKRDLPEAQADQYLNALQRAGVVVRKEAHLQPALSLLELDEPPASQPAPARQPMMTCPQCAHLQPKTVACSACGVVVDKYRAQQTSSKVQPTPAAKTPYAPPQSNSVATDEVGTLKVLSLQGRIGRMRYLAWSVVLMVVGAGIAAGLSALSVIAPAVGGAALLLLSLGMLVVSVLIGVQRLHDMGWSGWLWLLNLVPVINSVFWLILLVVPGSIGSNRYGPPSPANSLAVNLIAGTLLVLVIGGLLLLFLSGFAALAMFGLFFEHLFNR